MELDALDVVEHAQQVSLDGVRVTGLTEDLQQCRVRNEEESREQQTLLLQVAERFKWSIKIQRWWFSTRLCFSMLTNEQTDEQTNK